jgi:hypothetical protein
MYIWRHWATGEKTGEREVSARYCPTENGTVSDVVADRILLLPNGVTFYIFSDGYEFPWLNLFLLPRNSLRCVTEIG